MLIVFAGQPGTGKTTIARALSGRVRGVHLRIDTIEDALRAAGHAVGEAGYVVAYALAEDMLRLGQVVIADGVNPVAATRQAWRAVAQRTGVPIVEIEVVRTGAAARADYEPWDRQPVVIDTTGRTADQSLAEAVGALQIY
jgi:predicted kinase